MIAYFEYISSVLWKYKFIAILTKKILIKYFWNRLKSWVKAQINNWNKNFDS